MRSIGRQVCQPNRVFAWLPWARLALARDFAIGGIRSTGLTLLIGWIMATPLLAAEEMPGAGWAARCGYAKCICLTNGDTNVTLCPEAGGRVLEYSHRGRESLYRDPTQDGWTYDPKRPSIDPCGGRFDVGPERVTPPRPALWLGAWTGEISGPRAARLTSTVDPATGLQLVREFLLDAKTSKLRCTQTMINRSDRPVSTCHWSRTLASGGGICVVPLTPGSRFPKQYIQYGPGPVMNYQPADPSIRVRDGYMEVLATPQSPKLGIDSYAGWFGYLLPADLLFVKRYPVYPDRVYSEMAGLTISIWYYQDLMCELEPIGPRENLAPGQSASFTEEWWLLSCAFPRQRDAIDLKAVTRLVEEQAR